MRVGYFQKYLRTFGKKVAVGTSPGCTAGAERKTSACGDPVLAALADERFHFRTIPGIAAETGMPETTVRSILEQHGEQVRRAPLEDSKGNTLYAHRSRSRSVREILAETRAFLEGSK